jgi:hypothetical protein
MILVVVSTWIMFVGFGHRINKIANRRSSREGHLPKRTTSTLQLPLISLAHNFNSHTGSSSIPRPSLLTRACTLARLVCQLGRTTLEE